jgi:hypothetical protein
LDFYDKIFKTEVKKLSLQIYANSKGITNDIPNPVDLFANLSSVLYKSAGEL